MDFNGAMREWIDGQAGPYAVPVEAQRLVDHLRQTAPDVLAAWLDEHASAFVADAMGSLLRSRRATAQGRRRTAQFADVAERIEGGDVDAISELDAPYTVEGNTKALRDLTHADLEIVAADYEHLSATNAFEAAFARKVQKRLPKNGSKTVGDVFSAAQLRSLRIAA